MSILGKRKGYYAVLANCSNIILNKTFPSRNPVCAPDLSDTREQTMFDFQHAAKFTSKHRPRKYTRCPSEIYAVRYNLFLDNAYFTIVFRMRFKILTERLLFKNIFFFFFFYNFLSVYEII